MKNILITGAAGFIGSNFVEFFLDRHSNCRVISVDKLTYAADISNLDSVMRHDRHEFIHGDICDKAFIESLFSKYNIMGVVNLAAETHVDNSIINPDLFIQTNINGTFVMLNTAYKAWMLSPFVYRDGFEESCFLQISTDEVYGALGDSGFFTEDTSYAPNSPYSASKASADMLVRSYFHTFGLNVVITNCSNNYGPRQHCEKLIPNIIKKALSCEPIPIYGDGNNIRDWLYVEDHCAAIDTVFIKGIYGESYNVGANNEKTNNEIASLVCSILDKITPRRDGKSYREQIVYVDDRPGRDRRYAIDASKLRDNLGWSPIESFVSGLEKTVMWYLKYKDTKEV